MAKALAVRTDSDEPSFRFAVRNEVDHVAKRPARPFAAQAIKFVRTERLFAFLFAAAEERFQMVPEDEVGRAALEARQALSDPLTNGLWVRAERISGFFDRVGVMLLDGARVVSLRH